MIVLWILLARILGLASAIALEPTLLPLRNRATRSAIGRTWQRILDAGERSTADRRCWCCYAGLRDNGISHGRARKDCGAIDRADACGNVGGRLRLNQGLCEHCGRCDDWRCRRCRLSLEHSGNTWRVCCLVARVRLVLLRFSISRPARLIRWLAGFEWLRSSKNSVQEAGLRRQKNG